MLCNVQTNPPYQLVLSFKGYLNVNVYSDILHPRVKTQNALSYFCSCPQVRCVQCIIV